MSHQPSKSNESFAAEIISELEFCLEAYKETKGHDAIHYKNRLLNIVSSGIIKSLNAKDADREKAVEEARVSLLFIAEKVLKQQNETYAIDIKHADKKQWLEPEVFERIFLHRFNNAGIEALTPPEVNSKDK